MTLREAAEVLGIKVRTLREWLRKGKIHAVKDGKQWRISPDEIARVLDGNAN